VEDALNGLLNAEALRAPGKSVRRVEDITEALWGTRVSPSTVSNLMEDLRKNRGLAATTAAGH